MKNLLFLILFIPLLGYGQQVSLVKDFNNVPTTFGHNPEAGGVVFNGKFIYAASSNSSGVEPWATDGTLDGTILLSDIRFGVGSSDPEDFAITPNGVVFMANNIILGKELWITDGTPEGTLLLKDIYPGNTNGSPTGMVSYNDNVYFVAFHPDTDGSALWVTDGTEDGTQLFADLASDGNLGFGETAVWNGKLFMTLNIPGIGTEPWVTDGTFEGTIQLMDIAVGSDGSGPSKYTSFGDKLVFSAFNSSIGNEPYTTDGTPEGTAILKNINPGSGNSQIDSFEELNGELLFSAQSDTGRQVWKTDGSEEGTVQVSSINSNSTLVSELTRIDDKVYFRSNSDDVGRELFVTDGTPEGTTNVTDINPGAAGSVVEHLAVLDGKLFFRAEEDGAGEELWIYDPLTEELSTIDLQSGAGSSSPYFFQPLGDKLFFAAYDGVGYEPHITDGTEDGTFALADFNPDDSGLLTLFFVELNGLALFEGLMNPSINQLAVTDGTLDGTALLTTFQSEENSYIRHVTVFDDQLFMRADDGVNGLELWASDGTTEGTELHTDVNPGAGNANIIRMDATDDYLIFEAFSQGEGSQLYSLGIGEENASLTLDVWPEGIEDVEYITKVGNEVFFRAKDFSGFGSTPDIWKTDGTTEGTVKVKDFPIYGPNPDDFAEGSGKLWFFAGEYGTSSDWGLYTSDGTSEGTYQVKYFNLQEDYYHSYNVTGYNGGILFTIFLDGIGNELYFSDGTEEGTYLVKNIWPGSGNTYTYNFVEVDGIAYFIANSPDGGTELWRTDASEEGTYQVTDLAEGEANGAYDLINFKNTIGEVNGNLIFGGSEADNEFEVYISDGTAEGTMLLADINPFGSSNPHSFFQAEDYVYFEAFHPAFGYELWRTNGTLTEMVGDVAPSALSSIPGDYAEWGDFLYFSATNGNGNRNLYKYDQRCIVPEIEELPDAICLGEELTVAAEIQFSSGEIVSTIWDFDDGASEENLIANHTYEEAGIWTISLTLLSDNGCESIQTFDLEVFAVPEAAFELPVNILCISEPWLPVNTSSLTDENTAWSWTVGTNTPIDDENPSLSFNETGELNITLIATNGACESTFEGTIEVYQPEPLELIVVGVECFGGETGSIQVTGEGQGDPITYSTDGVEFSSNNLWEDLSGGTFTYYIQDGEGCIGAHSDEVPESELLTVSSSVDGDDGTGTGSIDVAIEGGEAPYQYSIDGITFQDSPLFENLLAGDYTVYITDAFGCQLLVDLTIDLVDGISELGIEGIRIFPNPANDQLTVTQEGFGTTLLTIIDLQGRIVLTRAITNGTTSFNTSNFAQGLYLIQFPDLKRTLKLQIIH
jgi:ELWxxDGT repeat protein